MSLYTTCVGKGSTGVAIVDLSGPWFTPAVAAFNLKVPYIYLEYLAARYNYFKESVFSSFISLIGVMYQRAPS